MKNANAYLRMRVIDACLRNRRQRYYIDTLQEVVCDALSYNNETEVSERTIREDLTIISRDPRLEENGVTLERIYDVDHRVYYRYSKPDFSIFEPYLTQEEAEQLSDTIQLLSKFKGLPQFEWLDETMARLKQQFELDGTVADMVSFAQNPDLVGMDDFFGPLFEAIVHHQVVDVTYHRFGRPTRVRTIHPYQLRQYNNRWYLVGFEPRQSKRFPFVVLPIDRIEKVVVNAKAKFIPKDEDVDFDDYFYDIIGVSLNPESKPEEVLLKAVYPAVWYMESKPIHPSQREVKEPLVAGEDLQTQPYKLFRLNIIPNEELVQRLLVLADQVEVLKPNYLRETIRKRAEAIAKLND